MQMVSAISLLHFKADLAYLMRFKPTNHRIFLVIHQSMKHGNALLYNHGVIHLNGFKLLVA
jgi:hypothetical protein